VEVEEEVRKIQRKKRNRLKTSRRRFMITAVLGITSDQGITGELLGLTAWLLGCLAALLLVFVLAGFIISCVLLGE